MFVNITIYNIVYTIVTYIVECTGEKVMQVSSNLTCATLPTPTWARKGEFRKAEDVIYIDVSMASVLLEEIASIRLRQIRRNDSL